MNHDAVRKIHDEEINDFLTKLLCPSQDNAAEFNAA